LNKVFPSKKEYQNQMRLGMKRWTNRTGLPSMPTSDISDLCQHLWSEHSKQVTCHITKSSINQFQQTFEGAIFHCEDKQSSSLRIYFPCLYYQSIEQTFQDPSIFEPVPQDPASIVSSLVETLQRQHGKSYNWAVGNGRQLPSGYILAKRKKDLSEWQTHHSLCGLSVSSYAQHPGSTYFPVDSSGVPKPLCIRRCLHTFDHP
jgi:hypothetical protein